MLLVRPRPVIGESVHGFLLRTSAANGLWSAGAIEAGWASALMARASDGMPLRGPMTGFPHLAQPDAGGLAAQYWNARRPRFCPLCLIYQPAWLSLWELVFYTDCHRHAVKLLDTCSSCRRPLNWRRAELLQCLCGAALSCEAGEQSSPEALKVSGDLARAWRDGVLVDTPSGLRVEDVLHRTWFLGAYGARLSNRALKLSNLFDVNVARAVAAASVLPEAGSPAPLIAWLDQVAARYGDPNSPRLTKRFGAFYKELFDPRREHALRDVRAGFEQYVGHRWPGQLAARNRRLSTDTREAHLWMPLTAAAKLLGWKTNRLRSAVERGVVRGHVVRHESGRTSGTVHRDDLNSLREKSRGEMTLLEVCAELSIGKKAAKALVDAGTLLPTSGPAVDGHTIWKFRRSEVEVYADGRAAPLAAAA